jgi:hypothetical protein
VPGFYIRNPCVSDDYRRHSAAAGESSAANAQNLWENGRFVDTLPICPYNALSLA